MSNNEKKTLVPRLRFPKFRKDPEWEKDKLEKLVTTISPPAKLQSTSYRTQGKFPIIDQSQGLICGWTDDESSVITEPLPLIVFGDHTCVLKFVNEPFAQGADGIKILKAKPTISSKYLFYSLSHRPLEMEDYKRHFSTLKERVVVFPDIESGEQQKIADSLSSLDEYLNAEVQKLDALKKYKKGLMHMLFPREGETVPRLRFPEFQDMGEWKDKSIGDFGEIITGSTPSTAHAEFYGGDIMFVSPADISDLGWVCETKTTLSALGFEKTRPVKANSVLFVCIGSTIGKVAQNVRDCATNQQINSVVSNSEHSGGFVYYILSLNAKRIAKLAGIQAVPIINKTQFSAIKLLVPEFPEQERIAKCLSSLDELITAQDQKINALKTYKRGLMQQLFPVLDEIPA